MTANTCDLTTLANVYSLLGIASTSANDTLLQSLITAASNAIEKYTQECFVKRSFTEPYPWDEIAAGALIVTAYPANIVIGGTYQRRIQLRHKPIVPLSVTNPDGSVTYYVDSIVDQDGNTIPAGDYVVHTERGVLEGIFIPPFGNGRVSFWTITYTAGRWNSTAAIDDASLGMAAMMTVVDWYKRRGGARLQSKRVGDTSLTYNHTRDVSDAEAWPIPVDAAALLSDYTYQSV